MVPLRPSGRPHLAASVFPRWDEALELAPQTCLETIDGSTRGHALNLRSHQPTVDVQIRLCHHRAVGVFAHPDMRMEHRLLCALDQPADLAARVLINAR